jgi:hypothetical protein
MDGGVELGGQRAVGEGLLRLDVAVGGLVVGAASLLSAVGVEGLWTATSNWADGRGLVAPGRSCRGPCRVGAASLLSERNRKRPSWALWWAVGVEGLWTAVSNWAAGRGLWRLDVAVEGLFVKCRSRLVVREKGLWSREKRRVGARPPGTKEAKIKRLTRPSRSSQNDAIVGGRAIATVVSLLSLIGRCR